MNIHDSGYKLLFSKKTIFRQLMETFVDEPWVSEVDFSQAETIDKSFIDAITKKLKAISFIAWGLEGAMFIFMFYSNFSR